MPYRHTVGSRTYVFDDLKMLLARATPRRAGDELAGLAAATYEERVAAQYALADVPLRTFLTEALVPYEQDEVTRLISTRTTRRPSRPSRISRWASCATGWCRMQPTRLRWPRWRPASRPRWWPP